MFNLIRYYPHILTGISLAMLLVGLLFLLGNTRSGLRAIISGLRAQGGRRRRIWPFVLAVLLLNAFLLPCRVRYDTNAWITLNYSSASQGLNPNKTRFNQNNILSAEVLERAIAKGALENVTAEELKKALKVRPVIQGHVEDESGYFISTQYVLTYTATRETAALDGQQLLTLVTQSYKEWFISKYSENTSIFKLDFSQIEQQDYLDMCSFFSTMAYTIINYMGAMPSSSFQSEITKETFASIGAKARSVADVMVEHMEAYVLEEHVSKSKPDYVSRLSFENVFLHYDSRKSDAASRNNLSAISMYENDMARIVLVPTYDTKDQFYMSQTRIGVDDFAKASDDCASQKNAVNSEIASNNHVIHMFSQGEKPDGPDAKAEELMRQLENELTLLAGQAKTIVEEYSTQQANRYMSISVSTAEAQARSLALRAVLLTLLFGVSLRLLVTILSAAGLTGRSRRRKDPVLPPTGESDTRM